MSLSGSPLEMVALGSNAIELTVLPQLGARLHRLRAFGHDVLRTPADPAEHARDTFFWGAFVMAPWCNRLTAGRLEVGGRTVDLPANFRDGTAIHGQVYASPWQELSEGRFEVAGGGDGWPWPYRVAVELRLEGATLAIEHALRNLANDPMPGGLGLHPWFRPAPEVAINAERVYASNTDSSAHPAPVSGAHDLRTLAPMAPDLDATWTELRRPHVQLRWPDLDLLATLEGSVSAGAAHITAASPSAVDAIAVEPQTHAPQGLRRLLNGEPGALTWLEPGAELRLHTRLTFHRSSGESAA